MTILNNLRRIHAAVIAQGANGQVSALGQALNEAAVQALLAGFGKEGPWEKYMAVFADNPQQLSRLTEEIPNEAFWVKQMRAYIVSNGICDAGTNGATANRITEKIDGIIEGSPAPPVEPNDPGGVILGLRPLGLKSIPNVKLEP